MAQFSRGITFQDGTTGHTASELHQLIDSAHILPGFITDQAVVTPQGGDKFIFAQASNGTLKSVSHTGLVNSFPRDAAASAYSLRRLGTGALMACAGNDARLRNPGSGFRIGQNAAADRAAEPEDFLDPDLVIPPVSLSGQTVIDWDAGNLFVDDLSGNKTYTFSHLREGRSIVLIIKINGHVATMPAAIGSTNLGTGTTFEYHVFTRTSLGTIGFVVKI